MNDTIGPPATALPLLRGERVNLRAPRDGDQAALFALFSSPEVVRYWSTPAWKELAQADAWLARQARSVSAGSGLTWAIARGDDDALIGTVSLHAFAPEQGRAEIGYVLHPAHWGRGLASEAVRLALRHAFAGLGLRRIEADTDPRNTGSCALLEALGFVREGVLRERWLVDGEVSDTALFGLLKGELR
ncbi:MAG TPA: GNAT family N-acetyltransferase [Xanthomonadaceae bacterium]|nr:GNAT family N-acetyltransferase [Xanthomonadaceae bacterium]